jgi:hypothetical protein
MSKKENPAPRAYTPEELRGRVLDHVRLMVEYWATLPNLDTRSRCDGVAFSILTMIDGSSELPPMALVAISSDEDKEYCVENGENWVEHGTVINDDTMLHEEYSSPEREQRARDIIGGANIGKKQSRS